MMELTISADAEKYPIGLDKDKMTAQGELTGIGLLSHGTREGRATVSMVVTLEDGSQVFAETSWRNFMLAAVALANSEIARGETLP